MASVDKVMSISLPAGADLSNAQFQFVSINNAGAVELTANNADAVGVLLNAPNDGQAAEVGIFGRMKIVASAAIANGAQIGSAANGQAKTGATGTVILGRAVEAAAAAGEVISFVFQKNGTQA